MIGFIRNIPLDKPFGFIKASTGLDSIFLHRDNFLGDWDMLVMGLGAIKSNKVRVKFELEEGRLGPRAAKCKWITEQQYQADLASQEE